MFQVQVIVLGRLPSSPASAKTSGELTHTRKHFEGSHHHFCMAGFTPPPHAQTKKGRLLAEAAFIVSTGEAW